MIVRVHSHQNELRLNVSVQGAVLTADDLTLISQLGQLIIQRPPNQTLCHQVRWPVNIAVLLQFYSSASKYCTYISRVQF